MKQILATFLIGFLAVKAFGQPSVDVGVFGGAGTYFGDMTKVELQKSINPAFGGLVRYNFNPRYALRFNVISGTIGAEGKYNEADWSFNKNVVDISILFEWNYLRYIVGDKQTPWSTFIFGGIGMQYYSYDLNAAQLSPIVDPTYFALANSSASVITPTLPFGLGVKYTLSKRWGIALETSFHKSMSDKLDNLDDPLQYLNTSVTPPVAVKFNDQFHNNDWTAYLGIHLVYKVIYGNNNWELRTPRKNMLDWGIWNKNRRE